MAALDARLLVELQKAGDQLKLAAKAQAAELLATLDKDRRTEIERERQSQ